MCRWVARSASVTASSVVADVGLGQPFDVPVVVADDLAGRTGQFGRKRQVVGKGGIHAQSVGGGGTR